jgi:hypothetical protein
MNLVAILSAASLLVPATAAASLPAGSPRPPKAAALTVVSSKGQPTKISISGANGLPTCAKLPFHLSRKAKRIDLFVGNPNGEHFRTSQDDGSTNGADSHTYTYCGLVRTGYSGHHYAKKPGEYSWRVFAGLKIHHAQGNTIAYTSVSKKRWIIVVP